LHSTSPSLHVRTVAFATSFILSCIVTGCGPGVGSESRADGWERATPASVGFDPELLDSMTIAIQRQRYPNVHALLIVKEGRLVYEQYFEGSDVRRGVGPQGHVVFNATTRHDVRSITKSVTSALVGIAIGAGLLGPIDQPIFDLFPEHAGLATSSKRGITLRHLLTMSSGLAWNELVSYADTSNDERRMNRSTDPVRFVLSRPLASAPGTVFNYSGGSPQLLAAAVQRAAGRPLLEYAREVLFAPLGITDVEWVHDSSDVPSAASGLRMRPVDVAKLGVLYLNQGRWRGVQVIPASWVEATRARQMELPIADADSGRHGYTLLWWHSRLQTKRGDIEVLNASGNGGQNIFVVPKFGVVVTIFGGRYDAGDYVTEDILVDHVIRSLR